MSPWVYEWDFDILKTGYEKGSKSNSTAKFTNLLNR